MRTGRMKSRFGWTLVELLVVMAVLGLLVGMLLPALQTARKAAQRAQCTSNLHQMGVALQAHHSALGYFPIGGSEAPRENDNWLGRPSCFLISTSNPCTTNSTCVPPSTAPTTAPPPPWFWPSTFAPAPIAPRRWFRVAGLATTEACTANAFSAPTIRPKASCFTIKK